MKPYTCLVTFLLAAQTAWALNPHPRIWLTPTLISTLQAKASANDADWLTLKAQADTYKTYTIPAYTRNTCGSNQICYTYEGSGWYDAMLTLALVYRVTGDTSYATQGAALLDVMNAPWKNSSSITPVTLDSGYPTRHVLPALAIGFDWLYPTLTSTQKTDTVNTINAAYVWFSTSAAPLPYCVRGNPCQGPGYSNYLGGHLMGFGLAADATDGNNNNSTTIYTDIRSRLDTAVGYALQSLPVTWMDYQGNYFPTGGFLGGGVPESYNYGTGHLKRIWQLLLAWKTSERADLLSAAYLPWLKNSIKNVIYSLRPNRWQVGDEGDFPGNCTGVLHQDYPLFLSYLLDGTTEGTWAEYLFRNLAVNPCSTSVSDAIVLSPFDAVVWKASSRTATDYKSTLGLNYLSDGDGHLLARSDWSNSAVFLSFNGSAAKFTDHHNKSGGNVEVQRGSDYLLVDSMQWKGSGGYGGTPYIFPNWATGTSSYASTLYFDDGGAYLPSGQNYTGGQTHCGVTSLLYKRADASVSYAVSDLGSAYDVCPGGQTPANRTARFYYRSVAYLGGNVVFVWDRFRASSASYTKRLQWHLNPANVPSVNGSVVSTSKGLSSLFINTLLPATPTIVTARDIATSDNTTPLTYNMQVSDSVAGTDLNGLTILYATASGGGLPSTVLITTDANWVGAQVADAIPLVAVFAKAVRDNANSTYTPLTYTSTTFTTTHSGTGRYLVAGLQPSTYSVFRNGAAVPGYTSVTVGTDGTLFFNAAAGAFSILQSGSTISPCDLNGDGVVNTVDVQVAINQALGTSPCGSADLQGNGVCNVVDIQRIIAAATGQACRIGQ